MRREPGGPRTYGWAQRHDAVRELLGQLATDATLAGVWPGLDELAQFVPAASSTLSTRPPRQLSERTEDFSGARFISIRPSVPQRRFQCWPCRRRARQPSTVLDRPFGYATPEP